MKLHRHARWHILLPPSSRSCTKHKLRRYCRVNPKLAANSVGVNLTTKVKLSYGRPQKQFKIIHLYFSMLYDAEHRRINLALCGDIMPSRHAGTDIFATHGPHILMGIEIYHGKPIFYSLGNLIMQNDTLRHVPAYPFDRFGLDPRSTPSEFFDHRTTNGTKGHPASPEFWQSMAVLCRF